MIKKGWDTLDDFPNALNSVECFDAVGSFCFWVPFQPGMILDKKARWQKLKLLILVVFFFAWLKGYETFVFCMFVFGRITSEEDVLLQLLYFAGAMLCVI